MYDIDVMVPSLDSLHICSFSLGQGDIWHNVSLGPEGGYDVTTLSSRCVCMCMRACVSIVA